MLGDEVTIEIESENCIDGESTINRTKAYGKCYLKNEKIYISYSEKLEGVHEEVPSLLTIDDNHMQISRRGEVRSTMKFTRCADTKCRYITSVGAIELIIHTTKYSPIITDEAIYIYLDYSVTMNGQDGGENSLYIKVK